MHRKFKRDNEGISLGRYLKNSQKHVHRFKNVQRRKRVNCIESLCKFKYQKCLKVSVGLVISTTEVADKEGKTEGKISCEKDECVCFLEFSCREERK